MKPELKSLAVILTVLGVIDLVMVPVMMHANVHHPNNIPTAAIILGAVFGVVTLASVAGLARAARWAFWTAVVTRVLDSVSALLGAVGGPGTVYVVMGWVMLALSVAAIVLLVRGRPGRAVHAATHA